MTTTSTRTNERNTLTTIEAAREGKHILIYTDGSCHGGRGPGGYAAVVRRMDGATELKKLRKRGQAEGETTNIRMEMTAAAVALEVFKPGEPEPIVIYSDNTLIVNGMHNWVGGWIENGWKASNRKPVLNRDLWERLIIAAEGKSIEWRWTKGHAGHPYNEEVDRLARTQMEAARAAYFGFAA